MVCSFSKQFYQYNNTIRSKCLLDSTHTSKLSYYKGSQLFSQCRLQFPGSGWPLPWELSRLHVVQSDIDLAPFLWQQHHFIACKMNITNPCFVFLMLLPVTLFSYPLSFAKHPWYLWSEAILAYLMGFCHKVLGPFLRLFEAASLTLLSLPCSSATWMMLFDPTGYLVLPSIKKLIPLLENYSSCVSHEYNLNQHLDYFSLVIYHDLLLEIIVFSVKWRWIFRWIYLKLRHLSSGRGSDPQILDTHSSVGSCFPQVTSNFLLSLIFDI